ncbi:hypothetical protein [Myxococcus landrumensis]|uniref:hypothetical protein n=1 Tax=Myxococcus landrumensis TaxID=2813577 RepID=UPI001F508805|nr:hypothetical protein [Myxococcus landrumus]
MTLVVLASACGGAPNHPPRVTNGPTPTPKSVAPGGVVGIVLEVKDEDGDPITYSWVQVPAEPAGQFSDPHAREPTWTAPRVTEPMRFLLQVNVTDDEGAGLLGSTSSIQVLAP